MEDRKFKVCWWCFKNFSVIRFKPGFGHYCSIECRSNVISKAKCRPECPPEEQREAFAEFKDKTVHVRRYCNVCRHGFYVPKAQGVKINPAELDLRKKENLLKYKYGDTFYTSLKWLQIRFTALATQNNICVLCGSTKTPLHVDHIKPRSKYPELALNLDNLQILCHDCNIGKGTRTDLDFDFRSKTITEIK